MSKLTVKQREELINATNEAFNSLILSMQMVGDSLSVLSEDCLVQESKGSPAKKSKKETGNRLPDTTNPLVSTSEVVGNTSVPFMVGQGGDPVQGTVQDTVPSSTPGSEFFTEEIATPSNEGGLNFDTVSDRFFKVIELVTNKMGAQHAAGVTGKLLTKHTGGKPVSLETLPVKNWVGMMADLAQVEEIANNFNAK